MFSSIATFFISRNYKVPKEAWHVFMKVNWIRAVLPIEALWVFRNSYGLEVRPRLWGREVRRGYTSRPGIIVTSLRAHPDCYHIHWPDRETYCDLDTLVETESAIDTHGVFFCLDVYIFLFFAHWESKYWAMPQDLALVWIYDLKSLCWNKTQIDSSGSYELFDIIPDNFQNKISFS